VSSSEGSTSEVGVGWPQVREFEHISGVDSPPLGVDVGVGWGDR